MTRLSSRRSVRFLVVSLALVACTKAPPAVPRPASLPVPLGFDAQVDEVFAQEFAFYPTSGTAVGLHTYDTQLNDFSRARMETRIVELEATLGRLAALGKASLTFEQKIDLQALVAHEQAELYDLSVLRTWEHNPMSYVSVAGNGVDGLIKRNFAPAPERLRSVIARLRQVPALFEAAKANVQNPPREFTELALRMAKGSVGFFKDDVGTWAARAAGSDRALAAEFEGANRKAVDSVNAFAEWLKVDLLPRSKGQFALGEERFLKKLKLEEMIDEPLPALLAKGQRQLEKDAAEFVTTAKRIDAKLSPAQVMKKISDDHPRAEDLIPSVRRSLEAVRAFVVAKDLVTVPSEVRPRVEATPAYDRSGSFASMDTPGAYETRATEAFYYVTPVEKDWDAHRQEEHLRLYNRPVVSLINIHEAFPGHYLQFLYAPRYPTKVRKLVSVSSNAEGWAHYAEQMMVDQGYGEGDPKVRLAQLSEALLRDCRYVAGIQMHTAGWTVEKGAKLFVERCFQEPANAYEEARRGAYNPTYLYYTYGKLEIQQLAKDYRAKKGVTLKQFHDAFVSQGSLPLPLVREVLFH